MLKIRRPTLGRTSLHIRAFLSLSLGIVLSVTLFTMFGLRAVKESTDRTLQEQLVSAQLAANYVDLKLEGVSRSLENEVSREQRALKATSPDFAESLLKALVQHPTIPARYLLFVDHYGSVLSSMTIANGVAMPSPLETSFADNLPSGELLVSNLAFIAPSSVPLICITAPLEAEPGAMVGCVVAAVSIDDLGLSDVVRMLGPGSTGYSEIIDGNGLVVASAQAERLYTKGDHGERFAMLIREGRTTRGTCHGCHTNGGEKQRNKEVLAFAPLSKASWGVTIQQSELEALAPARRLRSLFLALGALFLVGGMTGSWVTTRTMVQPLKKLVTASNDIADGKLTEPIQVAGPGEVGALATTFEKMRTKLRGSLEDIQAWNQELEDRVRHRSRELLALNAIGNAVSQSLNLQVILNGAVGKMAEALDAESSWVLLLDKERKEISLAAHHGLTPAMAEHIGKIAHDALLVSAGQNSDQLVAIRGQVQGAEGDQMESGQPPLEYVMTPLTAEGKLLGAAGVAIRPAQPDDSSLGQLLPAIGNQIALAVEKCRLYQEAKEGQQIRGELLAKCIAAQEEERKRIARELHDETAQALTALNLSLQGLARVPHSDVDAMGAKINKAVQLVEEAEASVDRLMRDLRPTLLDDLGLAEAIAWYAKKHLEERGVAVDIRQEGMARRLTSEKEAALFRVLQEAISNIARHANAHNVKLVLRFNKKKIAIQISDDGSGFSVRKVLNGGDTRQGLGLLGMKERMALIGGSLDIESRPGAGTMVRAVVEDTGVSAV